MRKHKTQQIIGTILFASLLLAAVFTLVRLILTPSGATDDAMHRSDYVLMLLQCVLGLVVMMLPSLLSRKWAIPIPSFIYVLYYVFLYCAIFLGEVFSFYYRVPHWDTILHMFSGAMLGALGFILVNILNEDAHVRVQLSPFFVSLFAFCFSMAMGALWEIYEYTVDGAMGLNMQKFITEAGEALAGRAALVDTLQDIISDALAALAVSAAGFVSLRRERKRRDAAAESVGA
ncbi:MAG: hypothetical protein LBN04_10270 [Oscillospiraceae bacterium]|jgi:uncharacterized membrane protein YjdF|nr:hypothetical protein [Oscillospiraceae bacterium]